MNTNLYQSLKPDIADAIRLQVQLETILWCLAVVLPLFVLVIATSIVRNRTFANDTSRDLAIVVLVMAWVVYVVGAITAIVNLTMLVVNPDFYIYNRLFS